MTPDCRVCIVKSSTVLFDAVWSERFHDTGTYELIYVLKGAMTLVLTDHRRYPLTAGELLILPPHTMHRDRFEPTRDLKVFLIHFQFPGGEEYTREVDGLKLTGLSGRLKYELRDLFARMRDDGDDGTATGAEINNLRLQIVLLLLHQGYGKPAEPTAATPTEAATAVGADKRVYYKQLLWEARQYMARNFKRKLAMSEVAAHVGVSRCHFAHIFHELGGETYLEYLSAIRVAAAKQLLNDTHLRLGEVAQAVGVGSGQHLIRIFRKHTGMTPAAYRLARRTECPRWRGGGL